MQKMWAELARIIIMWIVVAFILSWAGILLSLTAPGMWMLSLLIQFIVHLTFVFLVVRWAYKWILK